jgi:hypothetical protein
MDSYGFIITRHVNSEKTNKYWNNAIKCIRQFYPYRKIIIIDDNSNKSFLKADFEYRNVEYVKSEFPGRGELLPYYYYLKHKWFDNAVIIHDSIFFHRRVHFESMVGKHRVIPLWFFNPDKENIDNMLRISNCLNNKIFVKRALFSNQNTFGISHFNSNKPDWYGCFGVQSFINHSFLRELEYKYGISKLVTTVSCRRDRCALERIFGILFFSECPELKYTISLFGNIMRYCRWGYTYDEYEQNCKTGRLPISIVKVWTGR